MTFKVSTQHRITTGQFAALRTDDVNGLFWNDEDTVLQFNPPKSEWVNNHPYCLPLWSTQLQEIPPPPSIMVEIKYAGILA